MKPKIIQDHWFRNDSGLVPPDLASCALNGCGRPQGEHVETVGEWADPRHFFRPALKRIESCGWLHCARCTRRWGHSTHHGSRKNRSLWWDRWNSFWDVARRRK